MHILVMPIVIVIVTAIAGGGDQARGNDSLLLDRVEAGARRAKSEKKVGGLQLEMVWTPVMFRFVHGRDMVGVEAGVRQGGV